jgi:UDP-N-acetylmuramate dehydrogenase
MSWWSEFANRMEFDAPIGRDTWFRLGGPARYLFRPRDAEDLAALIVRTRQEDIPVRVLGGGANVLISDDGVDGVVVRLDGDAFRQVDRSNSVIEVGAGVDLMRLSTDCSSRGLSGLESMAGIPGTVGGAVHMNAGGRLGEFGDVVRQIRVLGRDGETETWTHERIGFEYRKSALGDNIVLSAQLRLVQDDPQRVKRRFAECYEQKRRSQPLGERSAGCIFKNPDGGFAGEMIDRAGLKGTCRGAASVSEQHANFIIARRGATASDVLHLIDLVRERVRSIFGVELETEIEIW